MGKKKVGTTDWAGGIIPALLPDKDLVDRGM